MNINRAHPRPRRLGLISLLGVATFAAATTLTGCQLVGASFAAFDQEEGPQPVAAQYTGLPGKKVAVLVQTSDITQFRFPESTQGLANAMTRTIAQNVEGVTVVPTRLTLAYQKQNPYWSAIPPSRLLRALEVDRLIVVDVEEYRTQEPGNQYLWRGVIDAIVSVYEAESQDPDDKAFEQRVRAEWPEGSTVGLTEGDDATLQTAALSKFTIRGAGPVFRSRGISMKRLRTTPFQQISKPKPSRQRVAAWLCMPFIATLITLTLPGCTIAAIPFAGFENYQVPATFVLPNRPTVLVVEARTRDAEDQRFARQIAARAQVQLTDNLISPPDAKDAPPKPTPDEPGLTLISSTEVARFQDRQGDAYYSLSIDALGRELGADTVIYAKVGMARLNDQGAVLQPESRLTVRVIDVRTGTRLWPEQTAGLEGDATAWPIESGGVHQTTSAGEISGTTRDRVWRDLADEAGLDLARLFYTWQRPQPGSTAEAEKRRIEREKRSNEAAVIR